MDDNAEDQEKTVTKSQPDNQNKISRLPVETGRVARAIFHIENLYLTIGDNLECLLEAIPISDLDPGNKFPPNAATFLALVTVFQFAEDLPDREACTALTRRMDWKYALHLPMRYPGLEPGWLCKFRQQLLKSPAGLQALQSMLERFAAVGLLGRGKRAAGSGPVLADICRLSQQENMVNAIQQALDALASYRPGQLPALDQGHWYERNQEPGRSGLGPGSYIRQQAYAHALGAHAGCLLDQIAGSGDPNMAELPEVKRMSEAWERQYLVQGNRVTWRETSCRDCPWRAETSKA